MMDAKKKVLEELMAAMEEREANGIPMLQITVGSPAESSTDTEKETEEELMPDEDEDMTEGSMPEGFMEMIRRKKMNR